MGAHGLERPKILIIPMLKPMVEFVINQSTINFKSGQSVLAIHDSPPYCWDQWGWRHDIPNLLPNYHEQRPESNDFEHR